MTNEIEKYPEKYNAVRINRDFEFKGKTLFFTGEIYNAPYCLIFVKWKEPLLRNKIASFFKSKETLMKSVQGIETLLQVTDAKEFKLHETISESNLQKTVTEDSILAAFLRTTLPENWSYEEYHKYSQSFDMKVYDKVIFNTASVILKNVMKRESLLEEEYKMVINLISKYNLSPRETECAIALSKALSNKEISEILNISEATVKRHVYNIFNKVGCDNRLQFQYIASNIESK